MLWRRKKKPINHELIFCELTGSLCRPYVTNSLYYYLKYFLQVPCLASGWNELNILLTKDLSHNLTRLSHINFHLDIITITNFSTLLMPERNHSCDVCGGMSSSAPATNSVYWMNQSQLPWLLVSFFSSINDKKKKKAHLWQ